MHKLKVLILINFIVVDCILHDCTSVNHNYIYFTV